MKCHNSRPKERDAKPRASDVALAPWHAPEESSLHVARSETNETRPSAVARSSAHAARKARKNANNKGECGHYSSDESSECDDETETKPGAYDITGPQEVNHLIEEDPPTVDGSNLVDDDVNARAMLVDADLAPELTAAEQVIIQEDEEMIVNKKQYKRVLFFAMIFFGLAIIGDILAIVLASVNPILAFGRVYNPSLGSGSYEFIAGSSWLLIATCVIWIPMGRCCRSFIRLEEYAPDDKLLLREAQIASTASSLFAVAAMAIMACLPNLQWLGGTFVVWSIAGALFAFFRVLTLRRPKETRQKKPKLFWVVFVFVFLGLTGSAIWGFSTRMYPDCNVPYASWIGDGLCQGEPACGYDGGDCVKFLEDYPGCIVKNPFWIADGTCDGGTYNTMECGYDGGDCVLENEENYPDCVVPNPSWIGNGKCDGRLYGTVECGFDGGDCLGPGERCRENGDCASEVCNSVTKVCDSVVVSDLYPNCSVDKPNWIGDGECDGGYYASEACGFDGGDCLEVGKPCLQDEECASGLCNADTEVCYLGILESYPDCIVEYPWRIGDGKCDGGAYATEVCGYDGGDCLKPLSISGSPTVFPTFHLTALAIFLLSKLSLYLY